MSETCRTLLVYGDSNTHGTCPKASLPDQARFPRERRWPGVMAAELGAAWQVVEEGLPGRTTVHPDPVSGVFKNGLAVLPAILESHRPIDLVILMLGTNDLKAHFALSPTEIVICVEQLARAILQSTAGMAGKPPALILVAPPRVQEVGCLAEIYAGAARKSRQLSPGLAELAQSYGLHFVDAATLVEASPVDGVHLDLESHRRLGREMASVVKDL